MPASVSKIGHIVLKVEDADSAVAFYCGVLCDTLSRHSPPKASSSTCPGFAWRLKRSMQMAPPQ